MTIFKKISQYNFKGSFEGWMRRITVNTILQKYRKENVFEIINDSLVDVPLEVEINDVDLPLDYLLKLIQELPDRYRLTFNLYVLDDYSHKEIANMMHITEGTSKSNLARAKLILKQKIEKNYAKKSNSL